jgi:hypothetical protein
VPKTKIDARFDEMMDAELQVLTKAKTLLECALYYHRCTIRWAAQLQNPERAFTVEDDGKLREYEASLDRPGYCRNCGDRYRSHQEGPIPLCIR